jgi:hypothetical protein
MHLHFNPGFYTAGVGRWDPDRPRKPAHDPYGTKGTTAVGYTDVPYDYGVYCAGKPMPLHLEGKKQRAGETWDGIITVKDQPGANFFQGGIGCDMSGNVAIVSNIWYVPKMMDQALANAFSGFKDGNKGFARSQAAVYHRSVQDLQKKGLKLYFVRQRPGLPLTGSTIWTYEHTGEVRNGPAGIIGGLIDEVQLDENGRLYFAFDKRRLYGGKPFLAGRGEKIGDPKNTRFGDPWTGTLAKTAGSDVRILVDKGKALIPMDENTRPKRPPDLDNPMRRQKAWMENYEWMYAGAAVRGLGCRCPKTRFWTDWYRRSFVSEQYRHSIGVVDTAGNVIMHVGQYGNRDSAHGPDISVTHCSFVSATDNYMIYEDECTRVTVLRLEYHSDETVSIELD